MKLEGTRTVNWRKLINGDTVKDVVLDPHTMSAIIFPNGTDEEKLFIQKIIEEYGI